MRHLALAILCCLPLLCGAADQEALKQAIAVPAGAIAAPISGFPAELVGLWCVDGGEGWVTPDRKVSGTMTESVRGSRFTTYSAFREVRVDGKLLAAYADEPLPIPPASIRWVFKMKDPAHFDAYRIQTEGFIEAPQAFEVRR